MLGILKKGVIILYLGSNGTLVLMANNFLRQVSDILYIIARRSLLLVKKKWIDFKGISIL